MPVSLTEYAHQILLTKEAEEKCTLSRWVAFKWQKGDIADIGVPHLIDRPARPEKPELRSATQMPKRAAGHSKENRTALLHALAHIELNAVDLAWDMIARFAEYNDQTLPRAYFDDWVQIADEEAKHFLLLMDRLLELDSFYGALPAHDGLWESAHGTKDHFAARLAVVPMVLEARGLDVTPSMIEKFTQNGDEPSARILKIIHDEEIMHVKNGKKWFEWVARFEGYESEKQAENYWQKLVGEYFHGQLKKPFNIPSRDKANFPQDWYEPLAG